MSETYFTQCLHESVNDLYRVAYGILGRDDDAQEAVSETIYRAYKNRRKIKEPKYLKTWLIRIVINISKDTLKQRKRYIDYDDSYMIEEPIESLGFVHDYINKLPTELKELVVLKYVMEYTYKEISEIKQVPESTIKSRVKRGLELLKVEMEELNND